MLPATNRGLSGSCVGELVGGPPGERGGGPVHLEDEMLQAVVGHRDLVRVERVGLDDVGAGVEVGAVDVGDHVGPGDTRRSLHPLSGLGWSRNRSPRKSSSSRL